MRSIMWPPSSGVLHSVNAADSDASHHHSGLSLVLVELGLGVLFAAMVMVVGTFLYRRVMHRTSFKFVPYESRTTRRGSDVVVTDCTAPKGTPTLTHHKGHNNPPDLKPSDTSTGLVLNAVQASYFLGGTTYTVTQKPFITSNHFDVDSFLAVWSYINRSLASQHEPVLRHMARIGDFREGLLSPELVAQYGQEDNITNIRDALTALKLVCWLNTLEKRLFSAPYEGKDCDEKFQYFLGKFGSVLVDPEPEWADWEHEYKMVMGGFDELLHGTSSSVEHVKRVGLTVLQCPEPCHYYSLFSHTHGSDVVLMMYDDQRYEVECKYTQYIHYHSRPVWPRLDMASLAAVLNSMEQGLPEGTQWVANRFTDSGPLLRLEREESRLTKAQRYGHPFDRPIFCSSIPPATMAAVVQSFLEYGLQGLRPKAGGWSWEELHTINKGIAWQTWISTVLEQHASGELLQQHQPMVVGGRRSSKDDKAVPMVVPPPSSLTAMPAMSDNGSSIMSSQDVMALVATCLPPLYTQSRWNLIYCTQRDGTSLHTLYRKAAARSPTVLVIKDSGGAVFGSYVTEPWKVHTRFYGTGETRVFQLHPRRVLYTYRPKEPGQGPSTDFFQFSTHEGLGVGGSGHFALWCDNDLLEGSSAECATFNSPCLASAPEFHVQSLELWHIH